ncbi:hypothetical protein FNV43_RR15169 [Rhamnella rubrinervis]|uniref:MATH domain-containing protein n=1 Tax=Rhamnella rubrinervis TaxID=2594499 RepID=A0A8K0E6T6_9ROSA|nr:hypothetical protein FNV43_RR15169 [Rhamnella rubrinervis]
MLPGTLSYKRDLPPAHYLLKVDSYTLLASELGSKKYDTSVFEAGGYKWRLSFYPNGDTTNNGNDHISLYLSIVETDTYNSAWEVNVNFKLFIYNQIEDKYLTQDSDGGVKRFHELKKQWGFARFLSLKTFKDSSNGYLFHDSCVFGVEIFVINSTGNWETLSLIKYPENGTVTCEFEIENFSKLDEYRFIYSDVFNVEGVNWKVLIYPKGDRVEEDKSLSFYLTLADWEKHPTKEAVFAKFILSVLSQIQGGQHCVKSGDI